MANRSLRLFLTSVTAMTVATMAQATALGVQVFDITGRELDLGLLGLAEFLPVALLAPLTGSLADRFDRRIVMAIGLGGEALASLALAALAWKGVETIGPVLAVTVGFGVFRAVAAPASRALPATLVPPSSLPKVIPLFSASWQAGAIAGPVLGGLLYAVSAPAPLFSHRCSRSAASRCSRSSVSTRPRPADSTEAHRGPGCATRWTDCGSSGDGRCSWGPSRSTCSRSCSAEPSPCSRPSWRIGWGSAPPGLGWLRAAVGIGASVSTLTLATRPVGRRVGRRLLLAVSLFGVATIVLGLTTVFAIAFIALLVGSAADAVSVNIRATLVPLITPDEYRGRVLAVENVFIGASNELGAFESGIAGQLLGAAGAIVLGGAATIVVVGVWWFLFPALRDVDRFADVVPPSGAVP